MTNLLKWRKLETEKEATGNLGKIVETSWIIGEIIYYIQLPRIFAKFLTTYVDLSITTFAYISSEGSMSPKIKFSNRYELPQKLLFLTMK